MNNHEAPVTPLRDVTVPQPVENDASPSGSNPESDESELFTESVKTDNSNNGEVIAALIPSKISMF